MKNKFELLGELGADEFKHIKGSLLQHLQGTRNLLNQWDAPLFLQDAGLYHAVYGTSGFDASLLSVKQRYDVAQIIGDDAEELVYQYCACSRRDFFTKLLDGVEKPELINRFTGDAYYLSDELLKNFCELTAANEVEIATSNPAFIDKHGTYLHRLFTQMAPFLSEAAAAKTQSTFLAD
ncbi:DUF6817 domain-containing protein [Agaribacter flavus]|uniref:DUF6817 domain-containing protein n=1 Tax=Agaribacter flavus TaxID=1902781 RepID=A0ABV7FP41_9ALTE